MKIQSVATAEDMAVCGTFQETAELVGRRWNGAILYAGTRGARRFSEYRAMVRNISDKVLALRLRELEAEGLLERIIIPSTPVQVQYLATQDARELVSLLTLIVAWGERRRPTAEGVTAGAAAGT